MKPLPPQQLQPLRSAAASANTNASVTADTTGFTIKSHDGDFLLKIGADLQVDNRSFFGGTGSQSLPDSRRPSPHPAHVLGNRLPLRRLLLPARFRHWAPPQFSTLTWSSSDFDRAKLRVGKFKPPVGLERLQSGR